MLSTGVVAGAIFPLAPVYPKQQTQRFAFLDERFRDVVLTWAILLVGVKAVRDGMPVIVLDIVSHTVLRIVGSISLFWLHADVVPIVVLRATAIEVSKIKTGKVSIRKRFLGGTVLWTIKGIGRSRKVTVFLGMVWTLGFADEVPILDLRVPISSIVGLEDRTLIKVVHPTTKKTDCSDVGDFQRKNPKGLFSLKVTLGCDFMT